MQFHTSTVSNGILTGLDSISYPTYSPCLIDKGGVRGTSGHQGTKNLTHDLRYNLHLYYLETRPTKYWTIPKPGENPIHMHINQILTRYKDTFRLWHDHSSHSNHNNSCRLIPGQWLVPGLPILAFFPSSFRRVRAAFRHLSLEVTFRTTARVLPASNIRSETSIGVTGIETTLSQVFALGFRATQVPCHVIDIWWCCASIVCASIAITTFR